MKSVFVLSFLIYFFGNTITKCDLCCFCARPDIFGIMIMIKTSSVENLPCVSFYGARTRCSKTDTRTRLDAGAYRVSFFL